MNGILVDNAFVKEIDEEIHRLKTNGEKEALYMNFLGIADKMKFVRLA